MKIRGVTSRVLSALATAGTLVRGATTEGAEAAQWAELDSSLFDNVGLFEEDKYSMEEKNEKKQNSNALLRRKTQLFEPQEHLTRINADKLHQRGITGRGLVVGILSSGVNVEHEALAENYGGNNGNSNQYNHRCHWIDVNTDSLTPFDTEHYGTFFAGVATGGSWGGGVAPDAEFIACKVSNINGAFTPEHYAACVEWFLQPGGSSGCKKPDVVLVPVCQACQYNPLVPLFNSLIEAGIFVVVSSGVRLGDNCNEIVDPPTTFENVLTVASLDHDGPDGGMVEFAGDSLGPPVFNLTQQSYAKPELTVFGRSVHGPVYISEDNYYFPASGAAVAAAIPAGAVMLLWDAVPCLRGEIQLTRCVLQQSVSRNEDNDRCNVYTGDFDGDNAPNYVFGYGEMDIEAAVDNAVDLIDGTCKEYVSKNLRNNC